MKSYERLTEKMLGYNHSPNPSQMLDIITEKLFFYLSTQSKHWSMFDVEEVHFLSIHNFSFKWNLQLSISG